MEWITVPEAAKIAKRHPITIRQHIVRIDGSEHTKKEGQRRYISKEYVIKTFLGGGQTSRVTLDSVKDADLIGALEQHIKDLKERLAWHERHNSQLMAELAEQRSQTARLIDQMDDLTALTVRLGLSLGGKKPRELE
jgi:uncharacterized coiled-coil protein SlyX